ncbi:hypothetical protein [Oleisolibacter albus]|uniref:hypothetical protein n=1 Tax=Oleisolibacter albus TaxID=2171757 RepID=UPI0012D84475|nr:hypothetical protein [Oleisolibacter albus]
MRLMLATLLLVLPFLPVVALAAGEEAKSNGFVLLTPQTAALPAGASGSVHSLAAGTDDPSDKAAGCRTVRTVEAGVAMGGVSGHYGAARVDYGRDDRALRAGAPNPCPSSGFAASVAVSQSDTTLHGNHNDRPAGPSPRPPPR